VNLRAIKPLLCFSLERRASFQGLPASKKSGLQDGHPVHAWEAEYLYSMSGCRPLTTAKPLTGL
jgi:hypothetical protein